MLNTPAAIAVDAGGTTTRALVVTLEGDCGPVARSGRGNPVGDPHLAASHIAQACQEATAGSGHAPTMVMAGVAGTLSRDFPELAAQLRERGLPDDVTVVSDLLGAYFSATAANSGSVMIVGTGAVAARVSCGQLTTIRDGLGWLLGDAGSGFWMGHHVARAVAADLDGRGPATSLTARVLHHLADVPRREGVRGQQLAALLTWSQERAPVELSALAVLAADEAEHDAVASGICERAATHALATLASLTPTDSGTRDTTPVILGGSVLTPGSPVGQRVHTALHGRALTVSDGVVGAALMAVKALGGTADEAMRVHILQQLRHGPRSSAAQS